MFSSFLPASKWSMFCNLNLPLSNGMGGAGTMVIVGTLPKSTGEWFGLDLASPWQWLNNLPSISAENLRHVSCCHPVGFSAQDSFAKSCELGVENPETTRQLDDSTTWHWPRSHFHHSCSYNSMLSLPLEQQWEVRRGSSHSHFPSPPRLWGERADSPHSQVDKCFTLQKLRRIHIHVINITS